MTLSCPSMVGSCTPDLWDFPTGFVLDAARFGLDPVFELTDEPDTRLPAGAWLLSMALGAPTACGVEEAVTAAVVSALDCAAGLHAIANADTIRVAGVSRSLIMASWNSNRQLGGP